MSSTQGQPVTLRRPPLITSLLASAALVSLWAWLNLWAFRGHIIPLAYAVPMLLGVWHRRPWLLWTMALTCLLLSAWEVFQRTPHDSLPDNLHGVVLFTRVTNIFVAAIAVHLIIRLHDHLEGTNASLRSTNDSLVQTNSELQLANAQLNAREQEITTQNEELRSQGEELEQQSQELASQAEDLQALSEELSRREHLLQTLLTAVGALTEESDVLHQICQRSLDMLGSDVVAVAVVEPSGDNLRVYAHVGVAADNPGRLRWPLRHSLAHVVMQENRTAALDNVALRPDLVFPPLPAGVPLRSILAAPLHDGNQVAGAIEFYCSHARPWTQDQFRLAEWVATQCSILLKTLRLREALRKAKEAAESASLAKDHFLAVLSHELRTPLTPVLTLAQMMEGDLTLPPDARDSLGVIRRNVELEARLIDDLLDLTRVSRGKLELHLTHTDVHRKIHHAIGICQTDFQAKGLQLVLDLKASRYHTHADAARLQQVLWNLLKNAVKFTPEGGRVTVRTHNLDDTQLRIEIADNGVGIDPDLLPRLFNAFEQGGRDITRQFGGLGLGLAISKAITELHGGTLTANSRGRGHGATFVVELPLTSETLAPTPPAHPQPLEAGRRDGVDILLVEDHEDTARVMARLLHRSGYAVQTATSVAAALALVQTHSFDLLISDVGLPDGTGHDLMRAIRQTHNLKGIAMSGFGMEQDLHNSREAGFLEHLTKPVNLQALQAAIARLLAISPLQGEGRGEGRPSHNN